MPGARRLVAAHVKANCQERDSRKSDCGPHADRRSNVSCHWQDDADAFRNLSDANEGREAACDAGWSLLLGSGF
jgi:hypothetical protein